MPSERSAKVGLLVFRALVAFAIFLIAPTAGASLQGVPPSTRFAPDLDVFPQNFAVGQDSHGIVYMGNTNGVLEFDGERWALTPLDNREIVRSLAVDEKDRVYVGGYNAMGYLQRDASGQNHYVDLTAHFAAELKGREFADIWNTLVTPEGIYFRAVRDVFFWDPVHEKAQQWHHEGRFGGIARYQDATLLQFRGEGFKRREGDTWTLLPETSGLTDGVFHVVPLADGGMLGVGSNGKWTRIGDGKVTPIAMPASMPDATGITAAATLSDGSIALASQDGVLYLIDPQRRGERHFKLDPGFLSWIAPTADGGFLVSANQAMYRVSWPSRWSMLGSEHGADGTLERIARWKGVDYLLSSAGTLRIQPQSGGAAHFEALPWSENAAYDLYGLDDDRALLATTRKLILVQNNAAHDLSDELMYPRLFIASRFRPQRVFVGTEMGLRFVDKDGEKLKISPLANRDLALRVSSLVEISATQLWFGTERHGLWHVRLDDAGAIVDQQRLGEKDGLQLGVVPQAEIVQFSDGSLYVTTSLGIFRWNGTRFVEDDLFGLGSLRGKEELLHVAQSPDGSLWSYSNNRLLHRPPQGEWREEPVRQLRRGAYSTHLFDGEGNTLFVTTNAIMMYETGATPQRQAPQVQLRSVAQTLGDGKRLPMPLQPAQPIHLPFGEYGINFQFALPDLSQERGRQYQGRLAGYESHFSDWASVRGYTYSRLSPGTYSLQVRARDSTGALTQTVPYEIVIDAPWYLRWWAYVLWILAGLVALGLTIQFAIRRRTRRLAEDKRHLETEVASRTQELALANHRLEAMATLDGLTGIANRRRLDEYLPLVWQQAEQRARPLAVLLIDVDRFKDYNDTHGHIAGDQLLKNIVAPLMRCLRRAEDLLARYGGEEFIVVMPGADAAAALAVAEAMRQAVENATLGTTVSIGVASGVPRGGDASDLVGAADEALYAAKHGGRNRVAASAKFSA